MTKADLVEEVVKVADVSKKHAEIIVNTVFSSIIDALQRDFEATITVIRTRVDLLLQEQTLALQDQNVSLLASVDKTTRSQAILQRTVESLSVIVITYYLAGLANYVFKALHELGWLANATYATAVFVPIALGVSFGLIVVGRRIINRRMSVSTKK